MVVSSRTTKATRMGRGGIVVDGDDFVIAAFTKKAATVRPLMAKLVVEAADRAGQRMRNKVPIGPGPAHVLDSIMSDQRATQTPLGVYADAGPNSTRGKHAFVARFLEHGTVKMSPRPFVGPAADETKPELIASIKALLRGI